MAKVFPILTRIINFIVIFFLIVASVSVFQNNVCRYDTNAFNQIMFYPHDHRLHRLRGAQLDLHLRVRRLLPAPGKALLLSLLAVCGINARAAWQVPVDTSFYAPEFPTDKNANFCKRCCCSFCWVRRPGQPETRSTDARSGRW
jgi:hypothetical protein